MSDVVVTIGRENGSGGREVGSILAGILGVKCYDREIIEETARKSGIDVKDVEKREESRASSSLFFGGIPSNNPLFASQSEAIQDIASRGPCVIVGRCADYVLKDRPEVVKVFVTAPVGDRIKRSAARNSISEKQAYERIRSKDNERAEYYRRYTGRIWGSVSNYDLSVNTGRIGVEKAAELIAEYIRMSGL